MNLAFITNDTSGCGYYRVTLPSNYLSQFHNVSILKHMNEIDLQMLSYDIFILQRPHQSFYHEIFFPWGRNRRNPKKFYIEMDDNLFELPDYNPAKKYWSEDKLENLKKNIECADGVICSTIPLADYIKENYNSNVFVIPNNISQSFPFVNHNNPKIRVGWVGSKTHEGDFSVSLIDALEELQDEIELVIYGEVPNCISHLRIENEPWTEVEKYHQTLYALKLDIGLIPSKDNIFNQSKSNIKFLEYSSCSVVSIADRTYPYGNSIDHNETGMIVTNKAIDWYMNLKYLIDNKEERNRLSLNSYQYVKDTFTFMHNYKKYWNNIIGD